MLEVKEIPLEEIILPERARKEMGDIDSLKDDIQRVGLLNPLILNDSKTLCAGARRLEALRQLNYESAPCRVLPGLSPEESFLIELVENVSRKDFTWDEEVSLKLKIHEYCTQTHPQWGYRDTSKRLGVALGGLTSDLQLAAALRSIPELSQSKTKGKAKEAFKKLHQQAEAVQSFDNLPSGDRQNLSKLFSKETSKSETPKPFSTYSMLVAPEGEDEEDPPTLPEFAYQICSYEDLINQLPDGLIGFSEIDPPYAIDFENIYGQTQEIETSFKDWTPAQLFENLECLLPKLYEKLSDDSWVLCWTAFEHALEVNKLAKSFKFQTQRPGFWVKPSGSTNNLKTNMISDFETYLLFRKGNATFNTEFFKACKSYNQVPSTKKYHPTQKPIQLYREFFRSLSKSGFIFFSPFAGSGASMVTSTFFGMTPVGSDLKHDYFYQFIKLLKEHSHEASNQRGLLSSMGSN